MGLSYRLEWRLYGHFIERLIIAILADGHLLVEGAPGLAKTKAIKTASEGIDADFHRVQFTPDLLAASSKIALRSVGFAVTKEPIRP